MARSRRRAMPRRNRVKADWVYRANAISNTPLTGVDNLGTYTPIIRTLGTGQEAATALVLYDSANYLRTIVPGTASLGTLPTAARADGKGALILGVEGVLYLEPTTWAVGNVWAVGMRLGILEQDIPTGLASVEVQYSMWANTVTWTPAIGANNGRHNMREFRHFRGFSTNAGTVSTVTFRWKGKRRLEPNEGLYLWMEAASTSVNVRYQTWCRTLVADGGE